MKRRNGFVIALLALLAILGLCIAPDRQSAGSDREPCVLLLANERYCVETQSLEKQAEEAAQQLQESGVEATAVQPALPDDLALVGTARQVTSTPAEDLEICGPESYDGAQVYTSASMPKYVWLFAEERWYRAHSELLKKTWFSYQGCDYLRLGDFDQTPDEAAQLLTWDEDDWADFLEDARFCGEATRVGTIAAVTILEVPRAELTVFTADPWSRESYEDAALWRVAENAALLLAVSPDGEITAFWRYGGETEGEKLK